MAKKGLRNFNQFITTNFCLGEVCLDLKPSQPQVYLNIPLINADEVINFPLAIYYSHGLATSEPKLIDNFRFSISYRFAFVDDNHIDVEFPDGMVNRYTRYDGDIFKSESDRSKLIKQDVLEFPKIKYFLTLENGYIYEFYATLDDDFGDAKLISVVDERNNKTMFSHDNCLFKIETHNNLVILCSTINENKQCELKLYEKDSEIILKRYLFTFSSDLTKLLSLSVFNSDNTNIETANFSFLSNGHLFSISTTRSQINISLSYDLNNKCNLITNNKEITSYQIEYGDYYSIVTNERNEKITYYYDSSFFPSVICDNKNHYKMFIYDSFGRLLKSSKVMITNDHTDSHINLLKNGNFVNSTLYPFVTNNEANISLVIDNNVPSIFNQKSLSLFETSIIEPTYVYQDIALEGYVNDIFTFSALTKGSSGCVKFEFYFDSVLVQSESFFTNPNLSDYYNPTLYQIIATHAFDRIRITFSFISFLAGVDTTPFSITAIQFIHGALETFNNYSTSYLTSTIKGDKTITYTYDEGKEHADSLLSVSSGLSFIKFDKSFDKQTIELSTSTGGSIIKTLDSFNRVIKEENYYEDKFIQKDTIYDENNILSSTHVDENNIEYTQTYSSSYLLTSLQLEDKKKSLTYDNAHNIRQIDFYSNNILVGAYNFVYDNKFNLTSITNNNQNYDYIYDNIDNLKIVNYEGNIVLKFVEYNYENVTHSFPRYVSSIKYGNNLEQIGYQYNLSGDLIESFNIGNIIYSFVYDSLDRISVINDNNLNYSFSFNYDRYNRISKINYENFISSYSYNNDDQLVHLTHNFNNIAKFYYDYEDETNSFNGSLDFINELESINGLCLLTLTSSYYLGDDSGNYYSINAFDRSSLIAKKMEYKLKKDSLVRNEYSFPLIALKQYPNAIDGSLKTTNIKGQNKYSFGCFIRKENNTQTDFLKIDYLYVTTNYKGYLTFGYSSEGKIILKQKLIAYSEHVKEHIFANLTLTNGSLAHFNVDIDNDSRTITVSLNGVKEEIGIFPLDLNLSNLINTFSYYDYTSNDENVINTFIAFPYFTIDRDILTDEELTKIKENILTNSFSINNIYPSTDIKRIKSSTLSVNKNNLTFTKYPLKGNFVSLDGKGLHNIINPYNVPLFIFDKDVNHKVYKPDKNVSVVFDLNATNRFSIGLKFKWLLDNGVLFEIVDEDNASYMKVFVISRKLMLEINGQSQQLSTNFRLGWNELIFSVNTKGNGLLQTLSIFKSLNGEEALPITSINNNAKKKYIHLGNNLNTNNHYKNYMSNFIFNGLSYSSISSCSPFKQLLNDNLVFTSSFNGLNQLGQEKICLDNVSVLTKNYGYNNIGVNSSRVGTIINNLSLQAIGNKTYHSSYSFGENNILIKDFVTTGYTYNSSVRYIYDARNRLQTVYMLQNGSATYPLYTYTYDDNGNILTINGNNNTFEYSDGNRISRHNNTHFYYNSIDPFLIEDIEKEDNNGNIIESIHLSYIGRRLSTYENDTYNISFHYDHAGKRIRKVVNDVIKEYFYEGDKLIASKIDNKFVYYFYDNNSIAGFIYDNNYYFYVKDVLGIIREVIDKDGIVKCSYDYTPFGKVINSSGDTTLLDINDILFKGYVYDKETELYWLSSRYYSPEFGRFIQPADVSSLNLSSINGLNLYNYANNNPISIHYNTTLASAGIVGGGGPSSPSRNLPSVPAWLGTLSTGLDNGFTMINPIRSAIACLQFTYLWDLMRLDGVTELPGALSKVATGIGWGLSIAGGVIAGYEKYASGASISSSIAGGLINAGISIGGMYASTAIATAAMGALAASSLAIPGGVIIVGGAVIAVVAGIAINYLFTKLEIGGNTIEGHLNNFVDWLIFWD